MLIIHIVVFVNLVLRKASNDTILYLSFRMVFFHTVVYVNLIMRHQITVVCDFKQRLNYIIIYVNNQSVIMMKTTSHNVEWMI